VEFRTGIKTRIPAPALTTVKRQKLMKRIFWSWALLLMSTALWAQTDSLKRRVFLLGDAGELHNGHHPVVDWLKAHVDWNDERNIAVWLGDNIYPHGLATEGEPDYRQSKQVLDTLLSLTRGKKARTYFIPGNHDWQNGKIGGWLRAQNQVDYINSLLEKNIEAWPRGGCPGPVMGEVDSQLVIVLADSQWFLHIHDKPGPGSNCSSKSLDDFTSELEEIIRTHPNQLVIVATHHPIYSQGVHGGAYTLKQHIFPLAEAVDNLYIPLPILGSVYPIARGVFGNVQDFNHPLYRSMAKGIEDVLKKYPNTIPVAGHDHSSQLLRKVKDSMYYIVAGAVAELTRVKRANDNLVYADVNYGFVTLDIHKSGKVTARFYNLRSPDMSAPNFTRDLFTIQKAPPAAEDTMVKYYPARVEVAANSDLGEGRLRRFFTGRNYRAEWTQKVSVPVFDLKKEQGGLKPVRLGGGKQTRSLRLVDSSGREWALRSIEKFPDAALPPDLRKTFAKNIVEQGVSASYPYASLSYSPFAEALGLPYIRRKLVYVPSHPALGRFRSDFSDVLAILEEREPKGVDKSHNTEDVVFRLFEDNDHRVDQPAVLRARLLDNFIMDFDRHEDQWRWLIGDTGKGKIYQPVARDHDQAFFVNEGIVPWLAKKPWFVPEVQGFRPKADNIRTLNRPARNFDRFFLNQLSEQQWQAQIDTFLQAMTDSVILQALSQQPPEVHQFRKDEIVEKLKKRRAYFRFDMMDYYRFLSDEVNVTGSNQREEFRVVRNPDKTLTLTVRKITKEHELGGVLYERTFEPKATEKINLYALAGDDRFLVEGGHSPIKVRCIGGPGRDSFLNTASKGPLRIYDVTFEENYLSGISGAQSKMSADPRVNRYNRLGFKYNLNRPSLSIAYNIDDGLFLGASLEFIRQGFRKEPFKTRHFLLAQHALATSSYRFRYEGDFIEKIRRHDLTVRADVRAPVNVTNFFGFGNNTYSDPKLARDRFFRIRYDIADLSVLARRQLQSWLRVNYGLSFQYFRVQQDANQNKFIDQPGGVAGVDYTTLYREKFFIGPHFKLDINTQNSRIIPTRGFAMDLNVRPLFGLNKWSSSVTRADIDMRIYSSLFTYPRFVLATRFGYGHVFGKKLEIPQAYYLSGINNLRGYRRDRFAGESVLYLQNELRFKIADFSTYLFPGSIGLLGFVDAGQVKVDGEPARGWYGGYGGGIWVAPVKRFVITGMLAWSSEERALPLITFGFPF